MGGRVCTRWGCLQVIAEKMKIHSYIHVGKKSISTRCFLKAGPILTACAVVFIESQTHGIGEVPDYKYSICRKTVPLLT